MFEGMTDSPLPSIASPTGGLAAPSAPAADFDSLQAGFSKQRQAVNTQFEQEQEADEAKRAQLRDQHIGDLQNQEQQLENFGNAAPQDQINRVMSVSPIFLALSALAGGFSRTQALTGLSAMNGMMQGVLKGDRQAFQDSQTQYENQFRVSQERSALRDQIYNELEKSYGDSESGRQRRWQIALAAIGEDEQTALASYKYREEIGKLERDAADKERDFGLRVAEFRERRSEFNERQKALKEKGDQGTFSDEAADLLASLAAKGVSLPSGLRSKQQMAATLNGLLRKYPNNTPDEIADLVKANKIDLTAELKEATTAATVAGKAAVGGREIEGFAPLVEEASKKVSRGDFVPINKLLLTADANLSDPNLKKLKIYINSMLNAYDQIAARGGTEKEKRAEAHALLTSADSPEALQAGVAAFQAEAQVARDAARKVIEDVSGSGAAASDGWGKATVVN